MGSSRPRNSTRASKAHPVPKPRRKPARSPETAKRKGRALRDGIKRFLAADRLSRDAVHERPKPAKPPRMTLQMIQAGLETASALVGVCADALGAQTSDSDRDVAIVLQRCALDTLERQRDRIESLLKEGDPS